MKLRCEAGETANQDKEVGFHTTAESCCGPLIDNRDCLADGGINVCSRRLALEAASEQTEAPAIDVRLVRPDVENGGGTAEGGGCGAQRQLNCLETCSAATRTRANCTMHVGAKCDAAERGLAEGE